MMPSDWTIAGNEQCRRMLLSMGAHLYAAFAERSRRPHRHRRTRARLHWIAGTTAAPSLAAP